jgi:hypothetical protein
VRLWTRDTRLTIGTSVEGGDESSWAIKIDEFIYQLSGILVPMERQVCEDSNRKAVGKVEPNVEPAESSCDRKSPNPVKETDSDV